MFQGVSSALLGCQGHSRGLKCILRDLRGFQEDSKELWDAPGGLWGVRGGLRGV